MASWSVLAAMPMGSRSGNAQVPTFIVVTPVREVTEKVIENPWDGSGPMTPPSVQHAPHCQLAEPVPAAAFHETSPPSSERTTDTEESKPVEVMVMASFRFPL